MFEGRYSLAVSPEGNIILPPAIRKVMHRQWGSSPALLCFGVQFLYICLAQSAEALLQRLDEQLCAAFPEDMGAVTEYFRRMESSVTQVAPSADGRFALPLRLMDLLEVNRGGLLTLLGVEDHLELWTRERLQRQMQAFESRTPAAGRGLLDTPICLQTSESPCSLLRGGLPEPKRCGPCVYLRLP